MPGEVTAAVYVVRNSVHGGGRYHLPTSDGTAALCGLTRDTPGRYPDGTPAWRVRGDRAEVEGARPDLMCRRCLTAERRHAPAQETAGEALRRYFRIGPRSPRHRRGHDLHTDIIEAIHHAAQLPGYFTEQTERALRPAFGAALAWAKHVHGYRLPGEQMLALNTLSPYQLTQLIDRMVAAGVTNTGEGERWFRAERAAL